MFSHKSSEVKENLDLVGQSNQLRYFLLIGMLAERFGAKWIFGGSILIAGILTLLTPMAARINVGLLIAIRLLIGAIEVNFFIRKILSNQFIFSSRHLHFQAQLLFGADGFHHWNEV